MEINEAAKKNKIEQIYIPQDNIPEACMVEGLEVYSAKTLADLVLHLNKQKN